MFGSAVSSSGIQGKRTCPSRHRDAAHDPELNLAPLAWRQDVRLRARTAGGARRSRCYFLLEFGLVAPGAMSLAPPARGVGSSLTVDPGARVDAPLAGSGVVLCMMWPGLDVETPRFGPPPLPPACASCEAIVAATSTAAQIATFFRVMRNSPVLVANESAGAPVSADAVSATRASSPDWGRTWNNGLRL